MVCGLFGPLELRLFTQCMVTATIQMTRRFPSVPSLSIVRWNLVESDEHNQYRSLSSGIQIEEEDDGGRDEHGCCRAVRRSSLTVKFLGI